MNRALRAAAMGVLLLTPTALSACSAGQVAQTAEQIRDQDGGQARAGDIAILSARLAYPVSGEYQEGGDARLVLAIANNGQTDDTLVSVEGEGFDGVKATGTGEAAPAASPAAGSGDLDLLIPADSNVYVGGDGPVVTLTGLSGSLAPGQALDVTMTFEEAGEVPVQVLVGVSSRDVPRGKPFGFHDEEAQGENAGAVN
ncbi:Protein of unknown function [Modestobacter sp. DSM 44400]|uniref:copper chaperone PCu(A)C n=1 Tax=Modestobacter sp. DSM 44400 TaxID=1550230 RepID=UPI00089C15CD|nr:copper chaperone PCu(A)C [Modestobacter sp. DSM 44400]SDX71140.1 Protein of unknown function [Modestobacter sp. DSM 44400]